MKSDEAYFWEHLETLILILSVTKCKFTKKDVEWLEYLNEILFRMIGERGRLFKRDVFMLRKRSKKLFLILKKLLNEPIQHGEYFVAGWFDSEGSVYLSTKSKIPVVDITQSEKGLSVLNNCKQILDGLGIKNFLNGPYKHWNSKLKTYHLRVYGKHARLFFLRIPLIHKEKKARFKKFLGEMQTSKL